MWSVLHGAVCKNGLGLSSRTIEVLTCQCLFYWLCRWYVFHVWNNETVNIVCRGNILNNQKFSAMALSSILTHHVWNRCKCFISQIKRLLLLHEIYRYCKEKANLTLFSLHGPAFVVDSNTDTVNIKLGYSFKKKKCSSLPVLFLKRSRVRVYWYSAGSRLQYAIMLMQMLLRTINIG